MKYPILCWLLLVSLCYTNHLTSQQPTDNQLLINYNTPQDYEIGGIEVIGANFSDEQAIIAITGFKIGEKVRLPSPITAQAIKALWRLQLFTDVQILVSKRVEKIVFLQIIVTEEVRYSQHSFQGHKAGEADELNRIVQRFINKGSVLTAQKEQQIQQEVQGFYIKKGYLDTAVSISTRKDTTAVNSEKMTITIDKKERLKIQAITFTGNQVLSDKKLRKTLENTHQKSKLFANSKYIPELLETDKQQLLATYQRLGYRDAQIIKDSLWRDKRGLLHLHFTIAEGQAYYIGNITWKGNRIYTNEELTKILGLQKGQAFNPELLEQRLRFSMDGSDISSLYMDQGYLFLQIDAVEKALDNQYINLEIRILEGPIATIDKVIIEGNSITSEEVIRRELRTKPGEVFSRSDIIRSQREIINLGYFNPENLAIETPVNPQRGTVDVIYKVEEKSSDQLEMSAGWGGTGLGITGTLGVTFNNFSLKKLLQPSEWNPLPQGDGQRLSMRIQSSGKSYQSYNFSFTEPWLGGKRPNSLTGAFFHNRYTNGVSNELSNYGALKITRGSLTYGTRLNFPDNYFTYTASLNAQRYQLDNWSSGLFRNDDGDLITEGDYNDLNISQTLARSSIDNPIFPRHGSRFALTVQVTPPYSIFGTTEDNSNWLEYHKWRFDAEWYTSLVGKLTLKMGMKVGYLGSYQQDLGLSPFGRFQIGGDGFNTNQVGFTGTDVISLRGYEVEDLPNNFMNGTTAATAMFQKVTAELRYPFMQTSAVTAYGLAFFEAGNSFQSLQEYQPFELQRSVGAGLRVFLPMFGTLGLDYGWGFDKDVSKPMGKLSIILGIEPE